MRAAAAISILLPVMLLFVAACQSDRRAFSSTVNHYELGMKLLREGQYHGAHGRFSLAVKQNRQNGNAHAGLILADTYRFPDHPEMHTKISRAARLGFDDYRILDMCGRQTVDHGNGDPALLRKAEALLISALALRPGSPSSHYYLGLIYLAQSDSLKAREHLLIATATDSHWQALAIAQLAEINQ